MSHSFKQLSFLSSSSWSFVWSSLGLTAMAFVTGALGLWVPMFLYRAQVALGTVQQCLEKSCNSSNRWAVQGCLHTHKEHCTVLNHSLFPKAEGRMWWWILCEGKEVWMSDWIASRYAEILLFSCLFIITQWTGKMLPALSKMERSSNRNIYRERSSTGKETSVIYWLYTSSPLHTHLGMFKSCILVTFLLPSC